MPEDFNLEQKMVLHKLEEAFPDGFTLITLTGHIKMYGATPSKQEGMQHLMLAFLGDICRGRFENAARIEQTTREAKCGAGPSVERPT